MCIIKLKNRKETAKCIFGEKGERERKKKTIRVNVRPFCHLIIALEMLVYRIINYLFIYCIFVKKAGLSVFGEYKRCRVSSFLFFSSFFLSLSRRYESIYLIAILHFFATRFLDTALIDSLISILNAASINDRSNP